MSIDLSRIRKKSKSQKVRINVRIFPGQKKRLDRIANRRGWSLERTVRKVFKEHEEYEKLLPLLRKQVKESDDKVRRELTAQFARDVIEQFQEFKVEKFGWDPDLASVELKHLDAFAAYMHNGFLDDDGYECDEDEDL